MKGIKIERQEVINKEWVILYGEKEIPLTCVKSFIQILFIFMFIFAYTSYNQLIALENVAIWRDYAVNYQHCTFEAKGLNIVMDCDNPVDVKFTT